MNRQSNSRKRVRDEEDNLNLKKCDWEEEEELIILVASFILLVVMAWYGRRYRVKEVTWNEDKRARKRALWMETLMDDTTCEEQLRLNRRCFEKLCEILQVKGGLVASRNVTIREIVALFLHYLAHNLKNRIIKATYTRSQETISRQFHQVLRAMLKIGNWILLQVLRTIPNGSGLRVQLERLMGLIFK